MKTIMIVRPENRMAHDVAVCEHAGFGALPFPLLRLQANENALANLPQCFQAACAVFWVSPSAVEMAVQHIDLSEYDFANIAVGQATAQKLFQAGAKNIHVSATGNDSENALALPIWSKLPENGKIAVVRGENGREMLPETLRRRGFDVCIADIYARVPQQGDWVAFQAAKPCAAWVTSSELVQLLFAQAHTSFTQNLKSLIYFAHHQRIVDTLLCHNAENVYLVDDLPSALCQLAKIK